MARFTVRVELHGVRHDEKPYEVLHEAMEAEGFVRTIADDDGIVYALPPAEYNLEAACDLKQAVDQAKRAAATTRRPYSILATESAGRRWVNLTVRKAPA